MNAEDLIQGLHDAFSYTGDNNRDLLGDEMIPMKEVTEELEVEKSYQFLIAYIFHNKDMINANLTLED